MAGELCEDKSRNIVSSSSGLCYLDVSSGNSAMQSHLVTQIQGFDSNPEIIFNLATGMEMIGLSKNLHHQQGGFFTKHGDDRPSSSSKPISESTTDFYQNIVGAADDSSSAPWAQENNNRLLVDDSSLRCVFPCEGNERPSQGLSLSLSSTNPTSIGLQSFELRQTSTNHDDMGSFFEKPANLQQEEQMMNIQGHFHLRSSKYLDPAQELLNEFCSLGNQTDALKQKQQSHNKTNQWDDDSRKQSLYSLDFVELHRRKTKLLSMLEEVDRRYRHYRDQMKGVVSSFESVAGIGAASVYSALAAKAMSRHFKCLRDGIVGQIQATRKAMGEKDTVAPGTTRGETPRLRILDQTLRQQRAFQQMGMMESHPYRPQRGLPERSVSVLRAWLFEHFLHPYPSDVDKHVLARQTGLSRSQVSNWFINARVRLWKPMVEEMYMEESKEQENNMACSDGDGKGGRPNQNILLTDRKPSPDQLQLVRVDSECLSSIIPSPDQNNARSIASGSKTVHQQNHQHLHHHHHHHHHQQSFGAAAYGGGGGAIELDFSSYTAAGGASNQHSADQSFNGGGVSLTLGLQQHAGGGNGVSLAFSAAASQSSLFYPRDHIGDCQPVQYSVLDGDQIQGQHLPYRNLMGAQLLHDLAG